MNFREEYGIRPTAVVKILMPPKGMETMGFKPSINLPVFGSYENVTKFRTWCEENFQHPHKVGDHPLYDNSKNHVVGYDLTIYGDYDDLLLLEWRAA